MERKDGKEEWWEREKSLEEEWDRKGERGRRGKKSWGRAGGLANGAPTEGAPLVEDEPWSCSRMSQGSSPSGRLTPFLSKARNMPSTYWVASSLSVTLKKRLNSCRKSVPLGHSSRNFLYHSCSDATSTAPLSSASAQLNCCPILAPGRQGAGSLPPAETRPIDSFGAGPLPTSPLPCQPLHHLLANRTGSGRGAGGLAARGRDQAS